MGWLRRILGLAPAPSSSELPPAGAELAPSHDLDQFCKDWGCTYERMREHAPDGTPGDVQVTLIRGADRVSGRGPTTPAAVLAAMQRGELLWGTG